MPQTSENKPTPPHEANGRRVAAYRDLLGLTQEQVGTAAGTTANYVCQVERGANGLTDYRARTRIAKALGLDVPAFDLLWNGTKEPAALLRTAKRRSRVTRRNVQ